MFPILSSLELDVTMAADSDLFVVCPDLTGFMAENHDESLNARGAKGFDRALGQRQTKQFQSRFWRAVADLLQARAFTCCQNDSDWRCTSICIKC